MFENIDRRKLIIWSLATLFIIVIALILGWLLWPKASTPPTVAPPTQPAGSDQISASTAAVPPASAARIKEEASYPLGLKQLAMAFAERYGSYSTDEPVKNLEDLESFMTADFKNSYDVQTDAGSAGIFSGFSTKALSSTLVKLDSGSATVVVKTQRTQTLGAGEAAKTYYADLQLTAVKSGAEWKISGAQWQ